MNKVENKCDGDFNFLINNKTNVEKLLEVDTSLYQS